MTFTPSGTEVMPRRARTATGPPMLKVNSNPLWVFYSSGRAIYQNWCKIVRETARALELNVRGESRRVQQLHMRSQLWWSAQWRSDGNISWGIHLCEHQGRYHSIESRAMLPRYRSQAWALCERLGQINFCLSGCTGWCKQSTLSGDRTMLSA